MSDKYGFYREKLMQIMRDAVERDADPEETAIDILRRCGWQTALKPYIEDCEWGSEFMECRAEWALCKPMRGNENV